VLVSPRLNIIFTLFLFAFNCFLFYTCGVMTVMTSTAEAMALDFPVEMFEKL
jgi:hypothetical protein